MDEENIGTEYSDTHDVMDRWYYINNPSLFAQQIKAPCCNHALRTTRFIISSVDYSPEKSPTSLLCSACKPESTVALLNVHNPPSFTKYLRLRFQRQPTYCFTTRLSLVATPYPQQNEHLRTARLGQLTILVEKVH